MSGWRDDHTYHVVDRRQAYLQGWILSMWKSSTRLAAVPRGELNFYSWNKAADPAGRF
jgi:hypothetical protein